MAVPSGETSIDLYQPTVMVSCLALERGMSICPRYSRSHSNSLVLCCAIVSLSEYLVCHHVCSALLRHAATVTVSCLAVERSLSIC